MIRSIVTCWVKKIGRRNSAGYRQVAIIPVEQWHLCKGGRCLRGADHAKKLHYPIKEK